jgi:hypothetical protein
MASLLGMGLAAAPAGAVVNAVAYIVPSGTAGSQAWTGDLGMDFDVVNTITITDLGVFDDGSDGLNNVITASVYDRNSPAAPLATLVFDSAGDPGILMGGSRFRSLTVPLILAPGFQGSIVAYGYGPGELNGNSSGGAPVWTTDASGEIAFVGSSRYNFSAGSYPASIDTGPANRYAAGTFIFTSGAVPVELSQFSID